ncbi:MAG: ABC transporter substrate-binding protein [Thermoleophilaceae bacterium]
MRGKGALALVTVVAMLAAGCGSSSNKSSSSSGGSGGAVAFKVPNLPAKSSVGPGEGQLSLICWAGYCEDGSTDPKVNWVKPFEKASGCQTTAKVANTSDEMVTLMRTGRYDGVSASGNASVKLIAGGDVVPIDTKLLTNWANLSPTVKLQSYNSVGSKMYGAPHGYGANLLMWRTDKVKPAPTDWSAVFRPTSPYKGKLTAYDDPIYIADAALYLSETKPALKITNPYELTQKQFNAAVALLKQQRKLVGQYWSDYTKEQAAFAQGDSVLGTTWQVITNLLLADKVPVKAILPAGGATGWSDTWMLSSKSKHPNCMAKWMNWIESPKIQAQVAEWFGEAPANPKACSFTSDKSFCTTYHVNDPAYYKRVHFWATPTRNCRDNRGNTCVGYAQWVQAWTAIKG